MRDGTEGAVEARKSGGRGAIGVLRRRVGPLAIVVSVLLMVAAILGLAGLVDRRLLAAAVDRAAGDPLGLVAIAAALLAAFSLRALAWTALLPGLRFGSALSAIHLALGANHVLPLRLGEPLRVVAAVRRDGVGVGPATATTVLLRSADILALLLIGLAAGPGFLLGVLGPRSLVAASVVAAAAATVVVLTRGHSRFSMPSGTGPYGPALTLTTAAWLLEAIVVWRVAGWFAVGLSATEVLIVLAVAVGSQVVAVTPAGIGTYEAAATAALVATGVELDTALAVAITLHGVKTLYSLMAGALAVFWPRPGLLGRWRLTGPIPPIAAVPVEHPGPVVLLLPAHDEGPRLTEVIAAAPDRVAGHPVEVLVVDDGSTDDTAARARQAGALVVGHGANRGLGAAVRTGLAAAVERGAVAVAFCDADGEYDPAELARLVEPILHGRAGYVVGSRFAGDIASMRPHRRLGNQILTRWVRHVVGHPVTDGQSGYRALSAEAAAMATIPHDYNYAQVLTIDLVGRGFGYHEVPISYRFRTSGRSFVRLGPYLRRVLPTVWRQLNQPSPSSPSRSNQRPPEPMESPSWPSESASAPLPSP